MDNGRKYRLALSLTAACLALLVPGVPAHALETEVLTGLYYYPSDAEKLMRAQTETAEDGLRFVAPRAARDIAKDYADEELRGGNVCLRQLRRDLKASLKSWRVRDLCEKVFHEGVAQAIQDSGKAHLHPDHVECSADAEARETGGQIDLSLTFHAQVVMRDRAPPKLRRAGIGGELTRWDLAPLTETLGSADGTWKDALKAGACSADKKALDRFWEKAQNRARDARELAECRDGNTRNAENITRIQNQLKVYVPEEWVRERAGDGYDALLAPPEHAAEAGIEQCRKSRAADGRQLEDLRKLSSRIADKYDVPALDSSVSPNRSPASETVSDDED